jgi:hypothetical protein
VSVPALRWAARVLGAVVCFALALAALAIAATQIASAPARVDAGEWLVIYAGFALSLVAAWLGAWALGGRNPLGRRPGHARPERPRRLLLARVALGWAVLTCGYMLSAMPFPPRGSDGVTVGMLVGVFVAALYAAIMVARADGARARVLTVWLGGWAAVMLVLAALRMPGTNLGQAGPAMALALVVAGSMWVALLVAGLLVWSVRAAWQPFAATTDPVPRGAGPSTPSPFPAERPF